MYGDEWPLRVTGIASAAESEWRIGQQTPERTCEGWLLVYVKSGMVEELCDTHRVLLRAGQILFHQPAELFAMRAVGEVPPEVFRMEFTADGSAMDSFRSCYMRLGNAEKSCLRQLAETVREVFQPCRMPARCPPAAAEIPFGGKELQTIYLAQLLYLLAAAGSAPANKAPVPAPSRSRQPLWKACACTLRRTLKSRWRWTRCAMPIVAPAWHCSRRSAPAPAWGRWSISPA